jgi:hypothetical protein
MKTKVSDQESVRFVKLDYNEQLTEVTKIW